MNANSSIRFETGVAADTTQPATPEPDSALDSEVLQAIEDTQAQLATMMVMARQSVKTRAAIIDPDLQPMGFKVLMLLSRCGPSQQSELARSLEMDKAHLSRIVKRLESMNLVVRSADPHDGRAMVVEMTERAHERYTASLLTSRKMLISKLSQWDLIELRRLSDLLTRLNEVTY